MSARSKEPRGVRLRRLWLIALREFRERVGQRAYLIALAIGALVAAAAVVAPSLIDGGDGGAGDREPVAVVLQAPAGEAELGTLRTAAETTRGEPVRLERKRDVAALRAAVRDSDVDVGLVLSGSREAPQVRIFTREGGSPLEPRLAEIVDRAALISRLQQAGGDLDVASVTAPVQTTGEVVSGAGPTVATTAVVSVLGLLLYIAGILLTTAYATGIVSDRTNHVTERLLTAASPSEHLGGKLIGVGASGLLQFAAWIAAAVIADVVAGSGTALDEAPPELLAYFAVALVTTYVLYAAAATVLVLPVRKAEDVSGATTPAVMLQVVGFIAATTIIAPGATVPAAVEILSLIPFFAPLLMLARIGGGDVAAWEVVVSIAGPLVLAVILLRVAAPAYARYSIDAPGGKGLGAAIKALRGR